MTDVLDRLRAADPAAHLDPEPPEALLLALAIPRPRRRRVLLPVGAAALAAAAAAVLFLGGHGPSLAARAYAQTYPGDAIVHSVETTHEVAAGIVEDTTIEQWQRGSLVHRVLTVHQDGRTEVFDQVLGADRVLRNKLQDGTIQETTDTDLGRQERTDPISRFRTAYDHGALQDAGTGTFQGRPAHVYTRTTGSEVERFYLDPESGAPLGCAWEMKGVAFTVAITTYERLDPTPANLAKLRW